MTASRLMTAAGDERKASAIDEDHLGRMTLGDRRLEREVLELFLRQTTIMLSRIADADPPLAAAAAHTLKGSARGIGAWRVARAAEFWNRRPAAPAAKTAAVSIWPKRLRNLRRQASRPARQSGRG